MKNLIILLMFSLIFMSCKDNDIILGPDRPKSDQELQNNIIGTWGSDTYKATYYGNSVYIDSSYYYDDAAGRWALDMVRTGKYKITDGIVIHSDLHYTLGGNPRYSAGVSIISYDFEILDITDNNMTRRSVEEFTRTEGNGDDIWGKWTTTHWVMHISSPETRTIYEGCQEYYYVFNKDSAKVTYGWKYLDGHPWKDPEFKTEYKYNPPYLTLPGPGIYDHYVAFKNGKMYWYYSTTPGVISRIK